MICYVILAFKLVKVKKSVKGGVDWANYFVSKMSPFTYNSVKALILFTLCLPNGLCFICNALTAINSFYQSDRSNRLQA